MANQPTNKSLKLLDEVENINGFIKERRIVMENREEPSGAEIMNQIGSMVDEVVVDCMKPELVVFLQDSNCQFVKQILMDREVSLRHEFNFDSYGVPFNEENSEESTEESSETSSSSVSSVAENEPEHVIDIKEVIDANLSRLPTETNVQHMTREITEHVIAAKKTNNIRNIDSNEESQHNSVCVDNKTEFLDVENKGCADKKSDMFHFGPVSGQTFYLRPNLSLGRPSFQSSSSSSFAFPILEPEWSGSPVRMTEANGEFRTRSPTWKMWFPCC